MLGASSQAQQPFFTDDADVTERGKFHLEIINEFDLLQKRSYPNLKQNATGFTLNYGLFERVELGINVPIITIFNAKGTSPRIASGVGDSNLSLKYNFLEERNGSRLPAMTVTFNVELPTGDKDRQLGTGLLDYDLNVVFQKTLTGRTMLRVNTGVLFSGNTLTGAVGIDTRGTVFTGGTSLVRKFTERLDLGAEITGAVASNARLSKGQLQVQVGGNYSLGDKWTLDFGLIAGRYSASPRLGAQVGFSIDF
jgi:Putative MetA-pathway of phenol degradation